MANKKYIMVLDTETANGIINNNKLDLSCSLVYDIGFTVISGYGITECSPLVSVNVPSLNDPSTVGIPLSCCEVKTINNTDEGIGEICVKGDIVMMGYYKDPERTASAGPSGSFFCFR